MKRGDNRLHDVRQELQPGAPVTNALADAVRRGWEDRRLGLPLPKDFETWRPTLQNNYEAGRRLCAVVQAYAEPLRWPPRSPHPGIPAESLEAFTEEDLRTGVKNANTDDLSLHQRLDPAFYREPAFSAGYMAREYEGLSSRQREMGAVWDLGWRAADFDLTGKS